MVEVQRVQGMRLLIDHNAVYTCGQCSFTGPRDVMGQINILSAHTYGEPGKTVALPLVKHRMPHNLRLMRRRRDTGPRPTSL